MSDYPKHYREEAYFPYVDEVDEATHEELLNAARSAISVFHIPQTDDDNWFTPCGVYLAKILTGKNINRYGENDNTVLLGYNMIPESLKTTPARKLTILW